MSAKKEPSLAEQFWNSLSSSEKLKEDKVLPWDKQPREIQDAFMSAINYYSANKDDTLATLVWYNAAKMA